MMTGGNRQQLPGAPQAGLVLGLRERLSGYAGWLLLVFPHVGADGLGDVGQVVAVRNTAG